MDNERVKVLYVDDEEGNLTAFRASFRRDFDVHTESSGNSAIAFLEKNPVHVVISDQRMPGMTGSEFLAIVRQRWPRSARLLLTGFSDIEAVIDAVNHGGIHAYITKPWDPTDLRLRIEQAYEIHALREERERMLQRYRQVFDASGDPIALLDSSGKLHDVNRACEELLGRSRHTLLSGPVSENVIDLPATVKRMREQRKGRTTTNLELELRDAEGKPVTCLATLTLVGRTEDGHGLFQAMVKDISEQKRAEMALKRTNNELDQRVAERTAQLQTALDDLSDFSYSVAHDLRSPLKNIKTLSEHLVAMAAERGDPEERDLSQRIHKGSNRLIALVDDLLRFARTDSQTIQRGLVDIGELARECITNTAMEKSHARFVLPEPGTAWVHADAAMVQVVLNNLLANALKFTRLRDEALIKVEVTNEGNDTIVRVIDNGVGFDNGKNEQLFGMFKRLHPNSQFEGTGIGLALVHRIMQKHGGSVKAEGVPDKGATFILRFPGHVAENSLKLAS
ncbi:MAG: sensor histidine kinase [Flavobacteriales bacterium]